jgi:hypothetical protein
MVFLVKMAGKARWQPSIFMPRVAARLFPEVKSVRIERLQDITEEDAKAEGAEKWGWFRPHGASDEDCITYGKGLWPCYKNGFAHIWEKINSENYPWNSNPWVWVIEFGRIEK